jgi:hypothetical protein
MIEGILQELNKPAAKYEKLENSVMVYNSAVIGGRLKV